MVVDSASVEFFNRDGSRPIYPYQVIDDREALISAFGMAMKMELVRPNRLRMDQDDCV